MRIAGVRVGEGQRAGRHRGGGVDRRRARGICELEHIGRLRSAGDRNRMIVADDGDRDVLGSRAAGGVGDRHMIGQRQRLAAAEETRGAVLQREIPVDLAEHVVRGILQRGGKGRQQLGVSERNRAAAGTHRAVVTYIVLPF